MRYISEGIFIVRGFIIAKVLGPSLFGIWSILKTIFYGSEYSSLGTSEALLRQVPYYKSKKDHKNEQKTLTNSFTIRVLISLVACIAALLLSYTQSMSAYKLITQLVGVIFLLESIRYFANYKLQSESKIFLLSKIEFSYAILNTVLGLSLLFFYMIEGLLWGMAISHSIILMYLLAKKELSLRLGWDKRILAELFAIGIPFMALQVSIFFMSNVDKIVIFFLLGSTMTGYYGLATFLSKIVSYIPLTISAVLLPRMSHKFGRTGDKDQIREYFGVPLMIMENIVPILMGLLYINIGVVVTYLLPQYIPSIPVLKILIMGLVFYAIFSIPMNILIALNKHRNLMFSVVSILILGTISDFAMIHFGYGMEGIAVVTSIMFFFSSLIGKILTAKELYNHKIRTTELIKGYVPWFFVLVVVLVISGISLSGHTVWDQILKSLIFVILTIPLINHTDKKSHIVSKLLRAIGKSQKPGMKRILMLAPEPFFQPRGTPISVYHRIKALIRLGYHVDLVTYHIGKDMNLQNTRIYRSMKIPWIKDIKIGPSYTKFVLDFLLFTRAIRLCFQTRYHAIHVHEEASILGVLLKRLFQIPLVYDMHSSMPQQLTNYQFTKNKLFIRTFRKLEKLVLKEANSVIAINKDLYETAKNQSKDRTTLIENTASPFQEASKKELTALRKKLGLASETIIAYIGTFEVNQGLDLLIKAASKVKLEDFKIIIVGGTKEQINNLKRTAIHAGISERLIFTGQVSLSNVPKYLCLADILVSPRCKGTNTPLKIYEYLKSGRAILATDIYSHSQVLNEKTALLVEPNTIGLAEGIRRLITDKSLRKELSTNARSYANSNFSYERYLKFTKKAYEIAEDETL